MSISFNHADKKVTLTQRNALKQFITKAVKKEGLTIKDLQYVFCSDNYLLAINRQFLDHDYYTDIISFNLSEQPKKLIGEIYISIDRVKDNAVQLKTSYSNEMLRVIFHGALHLCGYKDKTKADIAMMRSKEDYYLARYLKTIKG